MTQNMLDEKMLNALCVEEYYHEDKVRFGYGTVCSFRLQNSFGLPSVYVIDLARTVDMVMTTAEFFRHFQEISVVPAKPTAADMAKRTVEARRKETKLPEAVWDKIRSTPATSTEVTLCRGFIEANGNPDMLAAGRLLEAMGYLVVYNYDYYGHEIITSLTASWAHLRSNTSNI